MFNNIVTLMGEAGIYSVVVPFLLAFTLTYAVLEKIKFFGKASRYNLAISIIVGLLTTSSMTISAAMNSFLEKVGFGIIVMLGIILLLGIFGLKDLGKLWFFGAAVFLVIIYFQFSNPGIRSFIQELILNRYVLILIAAILTIWWITGSPSLIPLPSKPSKQSRIATPISEVEKEIGPGGKLVKKGSLKEEDLYKEESSFKPHLKLSRRYGQEDLYGESHAVHKH